MSKPPLQVVSVSDTPRMDFKKATGTVQAITGKQVSVIAGKITDPPHTDHKRIVMGESLEWDSIHRYGVLVHECCHILFPAKYDKPLWQLCNMIDDCRIERQLIASREATHYADALQCLVIEVIANQKYAKLDEQGQFKDPWSAENFNSNLWLLLFFRAYLPNDVREAASEAVREYAKKEGLWDKQGWQDQFALLIEKGLRVTRLKSVSTATLVEFCKLYLEVFPNAAQQAQQPGEGQGTPMQGDNRDANGDPTGQGEEAKGKGKGKDAKDEAGEGDAEGDAEDAKVAAGKPSDKMPKAPGEGGAEPIEDKGERGEKPKRKLDAEAGIESSQEADDSDLDSVLDRLKDRVGKVGTEAERRAEKTGEAAGNNEVDGEGANDAIDAGGGMPGEGDDYIDHKKHQDAVDKSFITRFKVGVRKLRCIAMDGVNNKRKNGRLHLPTVIRADHRQTIAKYPFRRTVDELTEIPVACCVTTDFSGSTEGAMNTALNKFTHNALYALQVAACENAAVIFNSGAQIVKTLDETSSAVKYKHHQSDGGTSLLAAAEGSIKALKKARAPRKVCFIFTDGAVYESEVPAINQEFVKAGFEAVLLVSLGSAVKRSGIVDTCVCRDLSSLNTMFDAWVKKVVAKGIEV